MKLSLFCPQCSLFLSPEAAGCHCGWQRPENERLLKRGEALWSASLGGPARGQALVCHDQVLFGWGRRGREGGLTAVGRTSGRVEWRFNTETSVEGGVALDGDRLFFGTLGTFGKGSVLYCLQIDGKEIWRSQLGAGVWSTPVVSAGRVYVGTDDGQVFCFDQEKGRVVSRWPRQRPKGRLFLAAMGAQLLVAAQNGQVFVMDQYRAEDLLDPVQLAGEIKSGPILVQGRAYIGTTVGRLYALDLRVNQARCLADGWRSIRASPAWVDGILYVGAWDHSLHAVQASTGATLWSLEFEHTIATTPVFAEGFLFLGANDGMVHAVDPRSGQVVWQFSVPGRAAVLGSPAFSSGYVYVGAESGSAFALPWHLGRYEMAADKTEKQQRWNEAGEHYLFAAFQKPTLREQYLTKVVDCWLKGDLPERAARLRIADYASAARPQQIGETCEKTARVLADRDPTNASYWFRKAAEFYLDAEQVAAAEQCHVMANRLVRAPYIRLQAQDLPAEWTRDEPQRVTLLLANRGEAVARKIQISFTGTLVERMWAKIDSLAPGEQKQLDILLTARSPGSLVVKASYLDPRGKEWWAQKVLQIRMSPSTIVEIGEDVGALHIDNVPGKVKVRGSVGLVKAGRRTQRSLDTREKQTSRAWQCPVCGQNGTSRARFCYQCGSVLEESS